MIEEKEKEINNIKYLTEKLYNNVTSNASGFVEELSDIATTNLDLYSMELTTNNNLKQENEKLKKENKRIKDIVDKSKLQVLHKKVDKILEMLNTNVINNGDF